MVHPIWSRVTCGVMALGLACGSGTSSVGAETGAASEAPALGKTDGFDSADRACQVILRSVGRIFVGDGFATDCSEQTCNWVWEALVDVAEQVPDDAVVKVLYHLVGDAAWYEAIAERSGPEEFGFRHFRATFSRHLFGPDTVREDSEIELVAFLQYPDGRRVFDHNHSSGDLENAHLSAETNFGNYFSGCAPVVGTIFFSPSYSQNVQGALREGGYLQILYMPERLPDCRNTHNGYPCWDLLVHGRFWPGGEEFSGSVRQFVYQNGTPTNEVEPKPFATRIPDTAESVEVWFENFSGCGSSCRAWDSNYGANYHFEVWPPADHPRCADVEKDNLNLHGEDVRMPHNEPFCVSYDLSEQSDATHCEFWPEDVGIGYIGHYGIPFRWIFTDLRVGATGGQVLAAGLFVKFHDNRDGRGGQRFAVGNEVSPGLWRAGFAYQTWSQDPAYTRDLTVDELAFFLDLRRADGRVVRLWQSHGGQNYSMQPILASAIWPEAIPYGRIQWVDQSAVVFESKHSCVR